MVDNQIGQEAERIRARLKSSLAAQASAIDQRLGWQRGCETPDEALAGVAGISTSLIMQQLKDQLRLQLKEPPSHNSKQLRYKVQLDSEPPPRGSAFARILQREDASRLAESRQQERLAEEQVQADRERMQWHLEACSRHRFRPAHSSSAQPQETGLRRHRNDSRKRSSRKEAAASRPGSKGGGTHRRASSRSSHLSESVISGGAMGHEAQEIMFDLKEQLRQTATRQISEAALLHPAAFRPIDYRPWWQAIVTMVVERQRCREGLSVCRSVLALMGDKIYRTLSHCHSVQAPSIAHANESAVQYSVHNIIAPSTAHAAGIMSAARNRDERGSLHALSRHSTAIQSRPMSVSDLKSSLMHSTLVPTSLKAPPKVSKLSVVSEKQRRRAEIAESIMSRECLRSREPYAK